MLEDETNRFIQFDVPLVHQQGVVMRVVVLDPARTFTGVYTLMALLFVVLVMGLLLFMMHCWLTRQWRGMERLEKRAEAILARYFRSDFVVLLPHRSLKEANSIADQLINAVDSLPPMRMVNRDDLIHIRIST